MAVHSCSWRGVVAARLTSGTASTVVPISKTFSVSRSTFVASFAVDVVEKDSL